MAVPRAGLVVGVDFGTLSGRAVVVRTADGAELASAVDESRHAVLTDAPPDRTLLGHDRALRVLDDYRDVLRIAVPAALRAAGADPAQRTLRAIRCRAVSAVAS